MFRAENGEICIFIAESEPSHHSRQFAAPQDKISQAALEQISVVFVNF
jgi:hypothetical protein